MRNISFTSFLGHFKIFENFFYDPLHLPLMIVRHFAFKRSGVVPSWWRPLPSYSNVFKRTLNKSGDDNWYNFHFGFSLDVQNLLKSKIVIYQKNGRRSDGGAIFQYHMFIRTNLQLEIVSCLWAFRFWFNPFRIILLNNLVLSQIGISWKTNKLLPIYP